MAEKNAHAHSHSREFAQERREECRRAVRGWLAERPTIAAHTKQILRGLNAGHEHDFTEDEVAQALGFLQCLDPEQVREVKDEVGATRYFKITSAGTLAHERDPLA